MTDIQKNLFTMQDLSYRDFHARLMPTIDKDTIIGVRTPLLRKYAKENFKEAKYIDFLKDLPHTYYEENNLHGFIIEQIKDYDKCIEEIEKFLPFIDNWATCDLMHPKIFKSHLQELLPKIRVWIASDKTYIIRFGIGMFMCYYLDDAFNASYLGMVADINSDEYYVKMMIAWYFATALAKQYDDAISYIEGQKLSKWTHNKTIQKAVESYRITENQKAYLKTLRL
ncbi:MAG: DNA alkylation repair protein [Eubacteriales bacterium]|nr:DNA alkylation repair protein [Eubacteriales bacterium]